MDLVPGVLHVVQVAGLQQKQEQHTSTEKIAIEEALCADISDASYGEVVGRLTTVKLKQPARALE